MRKSCPNCTTGNLIPISLEVSKKILTESGKGVSTFELVKTSSEYTKCNYCEIRYPLNYDTGVYDLNNELDYDDLLDELDI